MPGSALSSLWSSFWDDWQMQGCCWPECFLEGKVILGLGWLTASWLYVSRAAWCWPNIKWLWTLWSPIWCSFLVVLWWLMNAYHSGELPVENTLISMQECYWNALHCTAGKHVFNCFCNCWWLDAQLGRGMAPEPDPWEGCCCVWVSHTCFER